MSRFSAIAHRKHIFCSPISEATFEMLLKQLSLTTHDRIVDFGCGSAEMLIRVVERFGCHGVGVEQSPDMIALARERIRARGLGQRISIHEAAAQAFAAPEHSYALVLCCGARPFADSVLGNLKELTRWARPGSAILIGEGYWKQEPDPAYLESLGARRDEMGSHADMIRMGEAIQLSLRWSHESTPEEWDAYEGLYAQSMLDWLRDHPEDPDAAAFRDRITTWQRLYLQYGRDTLGFGLYLLGAAQ